MATFFTVVMTALLTQFANTVYNGIHGKIQSVITEKKPEPAPVKETNGPKTQPTDVVIVGMRRYKNGYTAIDNRMVGAGGAGFIDLPGRNTQYNQ